MKYTQNYTFKGDIIIFNLNFYTIMKSQKLSTHFTNKGYDSFGQSASDLQ